MIRIARTIVGVILVALGILAAITPLTPGSWLIPIGLEILGIPLLVQKGFVKAVVGWVVRQAKYLRPRRRQPYNR